MTTSSTSGKGNSAALWLIVLLLLVIVVGGGIYLWRHGHADSDLRKRAEQACFYPDGSDRQKSCVDDQVRYMKKHNGQTF